MTFKDFTGINDEIASVLLAEAGPNKVAEWNNFVERMNLLIIEKYDGSNLNTYKGLWKRLFKNNVKKLKLKLIIGTTDLWTTMVVNVLNEKRPKSGTEASESQEVKASGRSTSSLNYQRELQEKDYNVLNVTHQKLNKKWKLKSGRNVEDVIYEEAKSYLYEHPYHSYIVSLDDDGLQDLFSEEEIEEMIAGSGKYDLNKPFPEHLNEILKNLDKKSTYREIENCFMKMQYSRLDNPEEQWCVQSVLDYVDLFYNGNTVRTFCSEQTLFDEMYSFIKNSKKLSKTNTEFMAGSGASSENRNMSRSIGSIDKVTRQVSGDIPDLVFKYSTNELGCVEIGLQDNGSNGTKELNERRIKTPKMMRSFCWKLINEYKTNPTNVKIISFVISGPHITSSVMTFKHGSIGIVYTSSRMKMATTIKEVPRFLIRALKLTYNSAQIIKDTVQYLDRVCEDEEDNSESYFPPSFEPVSMSSKKRKSVHSVM